MYKKAKVKRFPGFLGALAGIALVVTGMVTVSAPEAAAAPASYCPKGYTCVWRDPNFKTNQSTVGRVSFVETISAFNGTGTTYYNGFQGNNAYKADNTISSFWNNGNWATVYFYDNVNHGMSGGSGRNQPLLAQKNTWVSSLSKPWVDVISSAVF